MRLILVMDGNQLPMCGAEKWLWISLGIKKIIIKSQIGRFYCTFNSKIFDFAFQDKDIWLDNELVNVSLVHETNSHFISNRKICLIISPSKYFECIWNIYKHLMTRLHSKGALLHNITFHEIALYQSNILWFCVVLMMVLLQMLSRNFIIHSCEGNQSAQPFATSGM